MSWIGRKEVVEMLKERGNPRSLQAIRNAGEKYGFMKKADDGFHYVFDDSKVKDYLNCAEQFSTISQFARRIGVSVNALYYQMLKSGIKAKDKYGIKYLAPKDCEVLKRELAE